MRRKSESSSVHEPPGPGGIRELGDVRGSGALAETWKNSKWADAVVITGPDRYEGFLQWQKFRRRPERTWRLTALGCPADLHRHLLRQLGLRRRQFLSRLPLHDYPADRRGYLGTTETGSGEICYANSWDVELAEGVLRSMDPIGVGTVDGEQCVRFQLKIRFARQF